jgi:hypothetical protein
MDRFDSPLGSTLHVCFVHPWSGDPHYHDPAAVARCNAPGKARSPRASPLVWQRASGTAAMRLPPRLTRRRGLGRLRTALTDHTLAYVAEQR